MQSIQGEGVSPYKNHPLTPPLSPKDGGEGVFS
jgi:hypothetical protein